MKKAILIILDGWGYRKEKEHNAIAEAKTQFFDYLWENYPHSLLQASGLAVGLPEGQMGNSEVGHMTIGAGKVIDTDLVRINKAIENGNLNQNEALLKALDHVKKNNSVLHLKGLLSPGGIHSHSNHLKAILKIAKEKGVEKIAIHAFMDGRDTPPTSGWFYLKELENTIDDVGVGFIATATGRFYAMDRDNNWDRLARAEDAIFCGIGTRVQTRQPSEIIKNLYEQGIVDEHLEPVVFLDDNGKNYQVSENDAIIFFNFRADRARMFSKKISEVAKEKNICFVTMTEYEKENNSLVVFPPLNIETTLAKEISQNGLTQAHIAETEKFAHATYFLNGGVEKPYEKEKHILVPSRKDINTHDLAPAMKAEEIAEKAVEEIASETNFIFINFANADMVGHTANHEAIIKAVETVDEQLKKVVEAGLKKGYQILITADHGNAEITYDVEKNEKHTAHTLSSVPVIILDKNKKMKNGNLSDVAPTILEMMGLKVPGLMEGKSLLEER
ncbi:MAG TPA: 2,3-bisphosphoglycerate-independent phosphoglycerate mutase [Candidatus Magasanikbacteria bacterium]|nr:2,3-bisphosphoglycerate-independent phosphoglycerate mutase [Candidatus Magasanikbacteria bacterium]